MMLMEIVFLGRVHPDYFSNLIASARSVKHDTHVIVVIHRKPFNGYRKPKPCYFILGM